MTDDSRAFFCHPSSVLSHLIFPFLCSRQFEKMKATRPAAKQTPTRPAAPAATKKRDVVSGELFNKENFKWMLIGVGVLILGFVLMAGGGSNDPNVFNKAEVYSGRRITVAPIIILIGLAIEIYAIFRQPKPAVSAAE
jgi:hypothetical protein